MEYHTYEQGGTYINPLTDAGFKILFARESSQDILIGFLNAVLDRDNVDPITEIQYLDKEKLKEQPGERSVIYDIHCKTKCGKRFIVEMQNRSQSYFIDRTIFYVARAITEQGRSRDWEYSFMPVYGIFISDFVILKGDDRVRIDAEICDMDSGKQFSDKVRLVYIQLPNFRVSSPEKCGDYFERWIYLLKNMNIMETMPFVEKIFKRVEQVARVENLSPDERWRYERDLKFYRDYRNQMSFAKKEAREEGLAEGRAEGRVEGRAESLWKVARNMLKEGLGLQTISTVTGFSIDELKDNICQGPDVAPIG